MAYAAVRQAVGADYTVGCRMLAEECIAGGNEIDDTAWFATQFAAAGMDFISLSRGGKFDDAEEATRRFRAHSDEIRATIDPARLLIYEVSQGWAPLCAILELPVPDEPFPVTNERDAFRVRAGLSQPVAGRD